MTYAFFTDGGARPNPGHAGYGVWLSPGPNHPAGRGRGVYLGQNISNNVAEYRGVLAALDDVDLLCDGGGGARSSFTISTDSQLLVRQLEGRYAVRSPALRPLHAEAADRLAGLRSRGVRITVCHVLRHLNRRADALATAAILARRTVSRAADKRARSTADPVDSRPDKRKKSAGTGPQ